MASQFHDPRGEYFRQCPYCLEYNTVNHLNRQYCPEKNGKKDFCKNRFKRLKNNLKSIGVVVDKPESKPLKIDISRDPSERKKTIDDSIHDAMIRRNKKILESLLDSDEYIEMKFSDLLKEGYEINCFDSKEDKIRGVPLYKVGRFAVSPYGDDQVYITYFKNFSV
jgi:hypothetical protein